MSLGGKVLRFGDDKKTQKRKSGKQVVGDR
jgi:hypothetical protein